MLKVGLTGGIGSGKSTVCRIFQRYGATIVDADVIARNLVEPGMPALAMLVKKFGKKILNPDGSLNRHRVREFIFTDSQKKQQLENILHPLVYAQIAADLENVQSCYSIVAVPLLLETRKKAAFDRTLVVDCSVETQIERVMKRDQLNREQVLRIIANQASREQRLGAADDVIDSAVNTTQLAEQVKTLHNSYIFLATVRT